MAEKKNWPLWLMMACTTAAIVAAMLTVAAFARASDDTAKHREEAVIQNGLVARVHEIESQIVPQVVWDDAVLNLDNRFSASWAHDNIGQFLSNIGDFAFSVVVNSDNTPIYAMRDGADATPASALQEARAAQGLIATTRDHESQRPSATLQDVVQHSSALWIDGRLFVVTATLVQPDFGRATIKHNAAPILITGREVDAKFLAAFADRYLLSGLSVTAPDAPLSRAQAHALIYADDGAPIAVMNWAPQAQAQRLFDTVWPWLSALLALCATAGIVLLVRARQAHGQWRASESRSLYAAFHDSLTHLPNRARFDQMLVAAVEVATHADRSFALHLVDLDRFRDLNDAHGHQVGDEALIIAAQRLTALCGEREICARLSGDEFALLQENIQGPEDAAAFAQKIIDALDLPFNLCIGARVIGSSVGIAVSHREDVQALELLRRADMAMYRAKAEGRGCYRFFDHNMDLVLKAMWRMRDDLKADLQAGKLHMVYQPQVRRSGEVVGVEALMRWEHDTDGPIAPSIFIPLAEESGLIHALGDFALRRAAEDGKRWPHLKTAVNVSATQLQTPHFTAHVLDIIKSVGADPRMIEIELTEGVLYADEASMQIAMEELHNAGFSIALDDFGTGYSSLSYLPKFPIDKIKIDRSFVRSLGVDAKADAILNTIVKLAGALEMKVIAEGVETTDQWLRLAAVGCPKVQGYIASRPLTPDAVLAFIEEANSPTRAEAEVTQMFPARMAVKD